MEAHQTHPNHPHKHGIGCGHTAIRHNGHVDYIHDGHLHHVHEDHVDEHRLEVTAVNPSACNHAANGHDASHKHGASCGHEALPHGDHTDYLVNGRLHHVHDGHCDDHGAVELVSGEKAK